ncbi:50S ribosomal protein L15 [candidate division WOR-3 bacterium]|nr:50S ribosomal protein L15 [candidate division WOR-3 bacterium]
MKEGGYILSNLKAPQQKKRKRVGRGEASGHGKTAGRGTKGQLSRSGSRKRASFEGGQTPLIRRIPKRGFKNPCRKEYETVNVGILERFRAKSVIDPIFLKEKGITKKRLPIKVLGDGEITKSFTVKVHKFSENAKKKIEKAGGKTEIVDWKKGHTINE